MVLNRSKPNDEILTIIDSVRILIKGEYNLKCSTDGEFLLRFIKASNYDVQASYMLIKDYFKAKQDHPDEFKFKQPIFYESVISRLDLGFVLHEKDYKGRPILLLRLGDIDPSNESWPLLMQAATITLESLSADPENQDSGVNLIFDCTNFSLKIMRWATPPKLKVIMKFLQDCIPLKFDVFHIVNAPLVFNVFFCALKPFMKEGFVRKLNWHKAPYKSLHAQINPSLLLPHMGGTLDMNQVRDWYQVVLSKEQFFKGKNISSSTDEK
ncbi:clavesin-1 [Cimex lectularius]|uniref:CRAL-TRIO domain-containing protein n=1 Tax=Cimex lectularius TaxID=79782 RepID=A0A8I6RQM5_CIMLE|nr:clavesin-1 [Cimex lectularius]XP_014249664.1 clavesin-1 [Cimex lectularius]XP_014249665.1 clavesin-1 [Cimex lectularius]